MPGSRFHRDRFRPALQNQAHAGLKPGATKPKCVATDDYVQRRKAGATQSPSKHLKQTARRSGICLGFLWGY